MKDWGFNFVRLGVMWESVERVSGQYNETYLDEMVALVNTLGENGIFSLVDMHQDVLSRRTCGEGIPTFIANNLQSVCPAGFSNWLNQALGIFNECKPMSSFNIDLDENGLPVLSQCIVRNFWDYQFTSEAQDTYSRIYYNIDNVQDKFLSYWAKLG